AIEWGAGRARTWRSPCKAEGDDGGSGLQSRNRNRRRVGQPLGFGTENHKFRRNLLEARLEPLAQRHRVGALWGESVAGGSCRGAKTGDSRHILGAGPQATLLAAALDERLQKIRRSRNQRTNALGGAKLVSGQREKIGTERIDIARNPAWSLDRVHMQDTAYRVNQTRRLSNRLDDAGLVVGEHERNEGAPRKHSQAPFQRRKVELSAACHRQQFHACGRKP